MGTRGGFGVRADGVDKIGYNQFDSYPEGKGVEFLRTLKTLVAEIGMDGLRQKARDLRVVSDKTPPTPEDIERLKPYTNLGVSEQSTQDWYCLTRESHGKLDKILECGYILDSADFMLDSLFCEWAYVANLDTGKLEVYKGFVKGKPGRGRFANIEPTWSEHDLQQPVEERYFPVSLVAEFDLESLPDEDQFIGDVNLMAKDFFDDLKPSKWNKDDDRVTPDWVGEIERLFESSTLDEELAMRREFADLVGEDGEIEDFDALEERARRILERHSQPA